MRRTLMSLVALTGALLTSSCLGIGGEAPNIQRHSIDLVEVESTFTTPHFESLAVRTFEGRQRYEARVLRVDEAGSVHYLENERWLEDPQDALTDVVREALARSGAFAVVGPVTSGFEGEYVLDGTVLQCDVRGPAGGPLRAVLTLRLDAAERNTNEMLHAAVYTAERELPGAGVVGVGPAISACAAEIVRDALEDWREARALREAKEAAEAAQER